MSSTASSQSARQGAKAKRPKKEFQDEQETNEAESVFEIPQEMQQMLQTFSRKILLALLFIRVGRFKSMRFKSFFVKKIKGFK